METSILEKGAQEAPQAQELINQDTARPLGAVALLGGQTPLDEAAAVERPAEPASGQGVSESDSPHSSEAQSPRYGYRKDSPPEEIALLHQAQAGSTEAFAELYRVHVGRVRRYVSTRMWDENRDAIPDVVQDAFCEAFAGLASARHDVTGWLLAHAAKAYIRHIRSDWKQERAVESAREVVRREYAYGHRWEQQPEETITAIGHVMLVHALARLTPDERRCIQHRYLEGQMQTTTAGIMGKTLRAVRSAEYRALVKLREGLAPGEAVASQQPPSCE